VFCELSTAEVVVVEVGKEEEEEEDDEEDEEEGVEVDGTEYKPPGLNNGTRTFCG